MGIVYCESLVSCAITTPLRGICVCREGVRENKEVILKTRGVQLYEEQTRLWRLIGCKQFTPCRTREKAGSAFFCCGISFLSSLLVLFLLLALVLDLA
jgi:hypothetical protein